MPKDHNEIAHRVEQTVRMLVEEKYDELAKASRGVRLTADQISEAISSYNGQIVMPPEITFELCDVIEVENSEPRRWSVNFDLWTKEEGPSDLTLELTLVENNTGDLNFEIDGIHVL